MDVDTRAPCGTPGGAPKLHGRAISFRAELPALDAHDSESASLRSQDVMPPNRRLSHTGSVQIRSPVTPMAKRKKSAMSRSSQHVAGQCCAGVYILRYYAEFAIAPQFLAALCNTMVSLQLEQ
jgi:hypothetical protein